MRCRTQRASWTTSWPSTRAVPDVGVRSVISILIVVVLPAPFGPSRPNSSPRRTVKLTPRTASTTSGRRRRTPVDVRYVRGRDGLVTVPADAVDAELLDAAGRALRIVAQYGVGYDNVDLRAASARGI